MHSWRREDSKTEGKTESKVELPVEGEPLTDEQYRYKHRIKVTNIQAPPPFLTFDREQIPTYISDVTRSFGFKTLTPVQAQAMPIIMTGRDFIGISKTGSGKTLAFLIPGICKIVKEKPEGKGPYILVLSPTRELAMQIENQFKKFLSKSNLKWACVYGGIKKDFQRHHVLREIQILVATPGRLIDFILEGTIDLKNVCYFVLDEADMMLDMGFSPQIREICNSLTRPKQSLMFSATWPTSIRDLASRYLNNPVHLVIGQPERTINDSISQQIKILKPRQKLDHLIKDLGLTSQKRLIFVQRKIDCQNLSDALYNKANIQSCTIHGDKQQVQRDRALQQFKTGKVKVLVATDVASRGLDIPDVELVINYDFPKQIEDYVHRIGRTGRAGKKGATIAYLVEGEDNRISEELIPMMRLAKQPVSQELVDFSRRKGNVQSDKFSKRYNYNYNPNNPSSTSLGDTWRSNKPSIEPKSMKNFDQMPPLRRFQSDRGSGGFKSQKFIAKSTKFIQTSKIFHPSVKFAVNDIDVLITFFEVNTVDVDTLIVPFRPNDIQNKTFKRLSKFFSFNLTDTMKDVPVGDLKQITKNIKGNFDRALVFAHETDEDSEGSYLVYILDKVLRKSPDSEKIGLFEIGAGKYPLYIECKMVLYTLFEVLDKIENEVLKEIQIYCQDAKQFTKYVELLDEIVAGIPIENIVLEN